MRRVALFLLCTACGGQGAAPSASPSESESARESASQSESVAAACDQRADDAAHCRATFDGMFRQWLTTQAVGRWATPHVVYTWTRAEQIEELRADPTLLTRSRGPGGALSALDQALETDPSPLARRIRDAGDGNRRFAWTSPWPTRLGWPTGDYGDRLIRIEITDDALVALYDETRDDPEEGLYAMNGARVDDPPPAGAEGAFARRALHEGHLGLVFHVGRGSATDGTSRVFREVIVVDEAVVARWEYGTPRIAQELGQIRTTLDAQRPFVPPRETPAIDGAASSARLLERWRAPAASVPGTAELWDRSLALGSERYSYDRETFDALIDALSAEQPGDPIDVVHVGGYQPRRRARSGGYTPVFEACRSWDPSMGCTDAP